MSVISGHLSHPRWEKAPKTRRTGWRAHKVEVQGLDLVRQIWFYCGFAHKVPHP